MSSNNKSKVAHPLLQKIEAVAKWAGVIGVIQATIWIGLSIVGGLFYTCVLEYEENKQIYFGDLIGVTIHRLYFYSANCQHFPMLNVAYNTLLTPGDINIWIWIYLTASFLFFLSSISLITHVDTKHLKRTNYLLYAWIFIVLVQSGMDLGLAIIFGLDYSEFHSETSKLKYLNNNTTKQLEDGDGMRYLAAEISSICMMVIAMRGFILWLINVGIAMFLMKKTFMLQKELEKTTSFIEQDFTNYESSAQTRPPVKAYETGKNDVVVARKSENRAPSPLSLLDAAAIERASKLSNAVLMSRKSRFANYEQYPPENRNRPQSPDAQQDYSPQPTQQNENPFSRKPQTNSFLKNQRYHSYIYNNNNNVS